MSSFQGSRGGWLLFALSIVFAVGVLVVSHFSNDEVIDEPPAVMVDVSGLLPHRAVYRIKTESIKEGSSFVNVSGSLIYEWQPDCVGARISHKFDMVYDYYDSPRVSVKTQSSSFEPYVGGMYFYTRRDTGGDYEYISGHVGSREKIAYYAQPKLADTVLPSGALFPASYVLDLVRAIDSDESTFQADLFDGGEGGLLHVSAVIGRELGEMLLDVEFAGKTVDLNAFKAPSHHVSLAFYDDVDENIRENSGEKLPIYEMKAIFYQNGVMRNVYIDYDDFVVSQQLESLEVLTAACR